MPDKRTSKRNYLINTPYVQIWLEYWAKQEPRRLPRIIDLDGVFLTRREREHYLDQLGQAYADERITKEDFERRVAIVSQVPVSDTMMRKAFTNLPAPLPPDMSILQPQKTRHDRQLRELLPAVRILRLVLVWALVFAGLITYFVWALNYFS